jgi:hypothetical protein
VVPAATEQRGEGRGDLRRESGVRVFSHRQSGPVPAFLSFGVPERTPGGRGWPGLSGWIKALFRRKMRNRRSGWAELRRSDERKKGVRGPHRGDGWRCSNGVLNYRYLFSIEESIYLR